MKYLKLFLISSFFQLVFMLTVNAETTLNFVDAFNIKAVNGIPYSSGLLAQNKLIKLSPGLNLIALEYEEVFDSDDGENFEIIKSNSFVLKIYLQKDAAYQQRYVKPHDANAAYNYRLNPLFDIVLISKDSEQQKKVRFELEPLASNQMSNLLQKTKLPTSSTINLTSSSDTLNNNIFKNNSNKTSEMTIAESTALKMLDYWWQQATPAERKVFIENHSINE